MKKQKFLLGAAGLFAIGLTACSNEVPVKEDLKAEVDQTRYLTIQLCAAHDGTTRGFEDGVSQESYVSRLDFFFYDSEGKPTGTPQSITSFNENNFQDNRPYEDGNVTRIFTSVVPVYMSQGDNLPSQVLCVVNGQEAAINELTTKTLEEIRDVSQTAFTRNGNFLMTNSVYYGKNTLTGQDNDRLCATPINANTQLFPTRDEAKKIVDNPTGDNAAKLVTVYVERMAAKVGLTMSAEAPKTYSLVDAAGAPVTLNFVPEYWLMNAVDDESYLTKHYGVEVGTDIQFVPTYAQIEDALNPPTIPGTTTPLPVWNWNAPAQHRSYWGTSPSYFDNRFPLVSDQVYDPDVADAPDYNPTASPYPVSYYTYNNVKANVESETRSVNKFAIAAAQDGSFSTGTVTTGTTVSTTGYIYTRETTTPGAVIRNIQTGNPAAAVASAVLLGHYTVGEGDAATTQTFYVDRNNGENGTYYGSLAEAKRALASRQLAITNADGEPLTVDQIMANNMFTVKHPDAAARGNLGNPNIAGRLVTLQLTAIPTPAIYFFDGETTRPIQNAADLAEANAQLVTTGYMDVFDNGLAFFSIPIRHLRWNDASYDAAKKQYNWQNMAVGELGVVRNHVYNITISGVEGLGNGLRSADQPIVPAKDAVNQYIAMRLNILSWNVANTWTVGL